MIMKLKEVCEITGITKRNIHYYIKEGLLVPRKELGNGYYEFSDDDCDRLLMIRSLRNAGFSLLQIRSILKKPSTSGYYINLRLKELKSEIEHAGSTIAALSYIRERLPLHIRYQKLEELVREAGIPSSDLRESIAQDFETYDNDLINRFLWESFLPDTPMTDYQEYLWSKVIRFSNSHCSRDYQLLSQTLHRFSPEQIEKVFAGNRELHNEVIFLSRDHYEDYARKMTANIKTFLNSPALVLDWKSKYLSFTAPQARLYDSEIAGTMEELSPSFNAYRTNIHETCRIAYDWIKSNSGRPLLEQMKQELGSLFDIENCSHGELQAMSVQVNHYMKS